MELRVSSPGSNLKEEDLERIERDLEKIDRRLTDFREVLAEVRLAQPNGSPNHQVTIELHYGRHHLMAKSEGPKIGQVLREARDDVLRQINDRSRGGHSSYTKGR